MDTLKESRQQLLKDATAFIQKKILNDEDLMTIKQTAKELGVHPVTLKKWKANGYGPTPRRIGKRIYYRRSEWIAFIDDTAKKEEP